MGEVLKGFTELPTDRDRLGYLAEVVKNMRANQDKINKLNPKSKRYSYHVRATIYWQETVDNLIPVIENMFAESPALQESNEADKILKDIIAQAPQPDKEEPIAIKDGGRRSGKTADIKAALKAKDLEERKRKLGKNIAQILEEQGVEGPGPEPDAVEKIVREIVAAGRDPYRSLELVDLGVTLGEIFAIVEKISLENPGTLTDEEKARKAQERGEVFIHKGNVDLDKAKVDVAPGGSAARITLPDDGN